MAISFEKQELLRCMSDPQYWLDNYGYCFNADTKQLDMISCYDYQREAIANFEEHQNNIVLKSRQCLPKGTLVDLPGGGTKRIEDFQIGDKVLSYNIQEGRVEEDEVYDAWNSGTKQCVGVYFNNEEKIETGENHPFFVKNKSKFVKAKDLEMGDEILHRFGEEFIVKYVYFTKDRVCYDISVKKNENYFISNLLVHNTGFSVISAAYVAWTLMFKSDQRILILANDLAGSIRLLKTVKDFILNTEEFLKPKEIVKNNEKYVELSNNSWVKAVACSPEAGRGESLTLLVVDEAAFIENDDAIKAGAMMAVSRTGGKTIMISTPRGSNNFYYQTWVAALKRENNYKTLIAHWTQNPFCNKGMIKRKNEETGQEYWWSEWYQEMCEQLTWDYVKIAQELDLSFESSKYLAVDANIIAKYKKDVQESKPICYFEFQNQHTTRLCFTDDRTPFWIYKKPEPEARYIAACDSSRGDGKDYSTIQILNAETLEQVAEYQGKVTSDKFADVIYAAAIAYNYAFVIVEANNMGLVTCYYLHKTLGYKNVYKSKSIEESWAGPRDARFKVNEGDEIPGFQTTSKTRPFLVESLRKYMREKQVILHSPRLISEFETFVVKENGKAEHEKNAHDDLIIALAIALYIRDVEWQNIMRGKKLYHIMLDNISKNTTPIQGVAIAELDAIKKKNNDNNNFLPIFLSLGDGEQTRREDLDNSWLFM